MTEIPIGKPEVKFGPGKNTFEWADLSLKVTAERITDDGKAELYFYHNNGDGLTLMHMGNANLLSSTMQRDFIKSLSTRGLNIDWQTVLTYVARDTMQNLRQGAPIDIITGIPSCPDLQYTIRPILEEHLPTTIYGAGASGKSYLADLFSVLVQFNYELDLLHTSWNAKSGNVLYLDWESTRIDHERRIWAIKQGLKLDDGDTGNIIFYRKCSQPLVNELPEIQELVFDSGISLVVIDSQMAASGYGPDAAQIASRFYNGLNSLDCTSLTIDHMSKEEWKGLSDSVSPYGSVVKYNRCRSLYEVQKKQYPGESYIDLAFIHRKHNEGMLQQPVGVRIYFYKQEDAPERVARVDFEWTDPENVMKQREQDKNIRQANIDEQIEIYLSEQEVGQTIKQIADALKQNPATIKSILNRHKDIFMTIDKAGKESLWGLKV